MSRIYESAAYAPQTGCFWADTIAAPDWPVAAGDITCDVAVIGAGFTGLSAALHLAQDGVNVAVFEAETPAYGASGRNGGFCCLGGAKAPRALIKRTLGAGGLRLWHDTQKAAIDTVSTILSDHRIDADTHSKGETELAHTARAMDQMRASVDQIQDDFGVTPTVLEQHELRQHGMNGSFFGAVTTPIGFALNPRKYHHGLAAAAASNGARIYQKSPVTDLTATAGKVTLTTPNARVTASKVILATNGYSSDALPDWLRARYLPVQSSILLTRPLTQSELETQGWTSEQMGYDSRTLLHYFRKLSDNRFLFGMRGGLRATPRATAAIRTKIYRDFHAMFPAWQNVEITHEWSGLICMMRNLMPFTGPLPDMPGVFASLGYHGNGVAMSSHMGRVLASMIQGKTPDVPFPIALGTPPKRFPLGRHRRLLLAPAYAAATLLDR